ncbi:MAG: hypothetical protein ABI876_07195 [Bacteroidota bacterium]
MRYIRQRSLLLLLLPALLAGFLLAACNDDPTPVGSTYLPQNVEFHSYTLKQGDFAVTTGISAASNSTAEGAQTVLVGKAAHGTVAQSLLAFTTADSIISGSAAKPVISATFTLRSAVYRYGDTASRNISFDVVVLDRVFSSNEKWSDALSASVDAAPALGTFTGTYNDTTAITVNLDPAATQKFLQEYFTYDSVAGLRELRTLKTIALRTHDNTGMVASFIGAIGGLDTLRPTLNIKVADTTIILRAGTSAWIANNDIPVGGKNFIIGAGIPVRALINLNIDSIPDVATIHKAELILHMDTANSSFGSAGPPNFLATYIATDTSFAPLSYLKGGTSGLIPVDRIAQDSVKFTNIFRMTNLAPTISSWLHNRRGTGGLKNQGLILAFNRSGNHPNYEAATVDRVAFFGPDAADPALRPSLTIIYSVQVDAKK